MFATRQHELSEPHSNVARCDRPLAGRSRSTLAVLLCLVLSTAYATDPSSPPTGHPTVRLGVDGGTAYLLDQAALASMPRTTVQAAAPGEQSSIWIGVALEDIIRRVCVASDDALHGRAMARFVRVTGADGYQVVFSAAELSADFGDIEVLLADSRDGKPLPPQGPFKLVVPKDKRVDRWVNYVTTIEVVDASSP